MSRAEGDLLPGNFSISWNSFSRPLEPGVKNSQRSWECRCVIVLRLEYRTQDARLCGLGEAAPLPGYSPDSLELVEEELSRLRDFLNENQEVLDSLLRNSRIDKFLPLWDAAKIHAPSLRFALECALLDIQAQLQDMPLWQLLQAHLPPSFPGKNSNNPVSLSLCTLLLGPDLLLDAEQKYTEGFRSFKLKVGNCFVEEIETIRHLLEKYPDISLRLDANGSWSLAEAKQNYIALCQLQAERASSKRSLGPGIEFLEQPLAPHLIEEFFAEEPLTKADTLSTDSHSVLGTIPIALDESLHRRSGVSTPLSTELERLSSRALPKLSNGLVLKPSTIGGLLPSLQLHCQATRYGLFSIPSHCFETAVGTQAIAHLAIAIASNKALGMSRHSALRFGEVPMLAGAKLQASSEPGLGNIKSSDDALSIHRAAQEFPDKCALVYRGIQYSYGELSQRVAELSLPEAIANPCGNPLDDALLLYASLEAKRVLSFLPANCNGNALQNYRSRIDNSLSEDRELALLLFSSGSSGLAKGVLLDRSAIFASAIASSHTHKWEEGDIWLCALPLNHIGGLSILIRSLVDRKTVYLSDGFDANECHAAIEKHKITHLSLVPTMLWRLLQLGKGAPESLRIVLMGGAATTPALVREASEQAYPLRLSYGMTESSSQILCEGYPLKGVEVQIIDGLLEVRGPMLMRDYLPPHDQLGALHNGWLRTQDRAEVSSTGKIRILGRADEVVISGGENIDPREVEAALCEHPEIHAAFALGLPHLEWGQKLVALVVCEGSEVPENLRSRSGLLAYKWPKSLIQVMQLPLLGNGKIDRQEARRIAEAWDAKQSN